MMTMTRGGYSLTAGLAALTTLTAIFWSSGAPLWIGWRVYTEQILVAALAMAMAIAAPSFASTSAAMKVARPSGTVSRVGRQATALDANLSLSLTLSLSPLALLATVHKSNPGVTFLSKVFLPPSLFPFPLLSFPFFPHLPLLLLKSFPTLDFITSPLGGGNSGTIYAPEKRTGVTKPF